MKPTLESDPLTYLKVNLGMEILNVEPIPSWQRRQNTYLVTTSDGSYALKVFSLRTTIFGKLAQRLLGGIGLSNQLKVLATTAHIELKYFKIPEFVASDGRSFTLTRYVPQILRQHSPLTPTMQKRRLALALLEWQQLDVELNYSFRERIVRSVRRQTPMRVALRTFRGLAQAHGVTTALRSIALTSACSRRSQRHSVGWLEHGDFTESNEFLGADGTIYFVDFESVSVNHAGRFTDIVFHAVNYEEEQGIDVDWELIGYYMDGLQRSDINPKPFEDIDDGLLNDLRLALLLRVVHYIAKYDAYSKESIPWSNDRALLLSLLDGKQFRAAITS